MDLLILLSAAFLVRIIGFSTPALWYDEAVSRYRANLPFSQYLADNSDYIGPNLWDIILRPFAHGPIWMLRIPSLLCALAAVYVSWLIMARLGFNRWQKTIASIFMVALPGLIWQSQDARFYAALGMLFVLAIWFAISAKWIGLAACAGLMAFIHPVGAAYGIAALIIAWISGMDIRRLIWSACIIIPSWIVRYAVMFTTGDRGEFWLIKSDPAYIAVQSIQAMFVNSFSPWLFVSIVILLVMLLVAGLFNLSDRTVLVIMTATIVPVIIMLLEGLVFKPVYFYRPAGPLCLTFCMLAGWILANKLSWRSLLPSAAALIILFSSLAMYNPAVRGGHIDMTAGTIRAHWQPGDLIVYVSPMTAFPYSYYLPEYNSCLLDFAGGQRLKRDFDLCPPSVLYSHHGRIWLIWNSDFYLPSETATILNSAVDDDSPMVSTDAWQFATINIYMIEKSRP